MSTADSWAAMNDDRIRAERKRELIEREEREQAVTPTSIQYSEGHDGRGSGKRRAWVKRSPTGEPGRWMCWRERADGALDLVTCFYRKRSAEQAARLYELDGTMKGLNF